MGRRKINLIIGIAVVIFSIFAIIASDSSSKFAAPFKETNKNSEFDEEQIGEVEGSPIESIEGPTPELVDESLEQDQTDESSLEESGQVEEYKVVKVIDGDTIDVDIDGKTERLRLIGIDTPETVDPRKSVQCFGKEASNKAKELLSGKFVRLESDETQGDRDKYKRLLRYVFLQDSTNFNLYMIAEGFAHEYTYDEPYKYQFDFKEAERAARENSKGLWNPSVCPN